MSERWFKSLYLTLTRDEIEPIMRGHVTSAEFRVLVALFDHANRGTGECWPKRQTLAEKTNLSLGAVKKALGALEAKGYLISEARFDAGGGRTSNLYRVKFGRPCQEPAPATQVAGAGHTSSRQEPITIEPRTKEPLKDSVHFEEFWGLWPTKKGKGAARTAHAKACGKADPEAILAAVRAQLPDLAENKARGFGVHATTWLNQERWEDEVEGVAEQAEVGAEWVALADRLAPPWRVGRADEVTLAAVAAREGWSREQIENRLTYFVEFYEQLDWPLPSLAGVLTAPEGKLTDRFLEGLQSEAKRPRRGRA